MQVFSYPFRLTPTGRVALVEQSTDEEAAQLIAGLLQTYRGELPMTPGYGQADQVFNRIDVSAIAADMSRFYPNITILELKYNDANAEGKVKMEINFDVES